MSATTTTPASTSVAIVAATVLGLSAGSMLNEAVVLVGFWRSLPAQEFLDWYAGNAGRLSGYYGPLQIAGALLAITAAVLYRVRRYSGSGLLVLSAVLAAAALVTFFVYFKDANANFAAGTVAVDRVPAELARWSSWQWGRTAIGIGAFVSALFGVRSRDV